MMSKVIYVFFLLHTVFNEAFDTSSIVSFDAIFVDTLSRLRDEFLESLYDTKKQIKADLRRDLSEIMETTLFDLLRSGELDRLLTNERQAEMDLLTRSVSQIKQKLYHLARKQEWSEELAKQIVEEKKNGKKTECARRVAEKDKLKNLFNSNATKSTTLTTTSPPLQDEAIRTYTALLTPDRYEYFPLEDLDVKLSPGRTSFVFDVRAKNDAHLALHNYAGNTDRETYEIVIGGWANRKSAIRASKQTANMVSFENDPLHDQEFVPFWISWNKGVVAVGSGRTVGVNQFMIWSDPSPHPVHFISVSTGWGATDEKRNIVTPDLYKYTGELELQPGQMSFRFEVRAKNDAHLALHNYAGNTDRETYEIVIGGWANRKSGIRASKQTANMVSFENDPLNDQEFVPFWISWNKGVVVVGSGRTVGVNQFMSWSDPSPHPVHFISVSTGWGATGDWWLETM